MKYDNWLFGKDGALFNASANGKVELVRQLVSEGANVNVASRAGYTPLHRAAEKGHKDVVLLLLSNSASVHATSKDLQTPVSLASSNGHTEIVEILSNYTGKMKSNIVLIGFMGSGKTSVGRLLAAQLNMNFLDMDKVIEERSRKPISAIFAEDGEPHFRRLERELAKELSARNGLVIATGGGIVLDPDNVRDFSKTGLVVCLSADPEAILARLDGDKTRPLLASEDKMQKITAILDSRRSLYSSIPNQIDTTHLTVDEVVVRIRQMAPAEGQ